MTTSEGRNQNVLFPKEYLQFIQAFNQGEYFEAHEILEALWKRANRSPFYQALIHLAVGHYHFYRGNLYGALRQFRKALQRFEGYPSPYMGINLQKLSQWLQETINSLEAPPSSKEKTPALTPISLRLETKSLKLGGEEENDLL